MTWAPGPLAGGDPAAARLLERARAAVSDARLARRCLAMVDVPSPTGEELPLARWIAGELEAAGMESEVQVIEGLQGNAVGRLRGGSDGPSLLVYAPIDAPFSGHVDEDRPWLGGAPGADFAVPGRQEGDWIIGLGAENPKSFAACVLEAVTAFAETGAAPSGEIVAGFGAGGMPTSGRPGLARRDIGHGRGCAHMLDHGVTPDAAVIVKPGFAVSWEEVGLSWHRITINGERGYTGLRHRGIGRNPIIAAAALIEALEAWFPSYTARHTSGLVSPQGSIGAIAAGSADLAAFVPATCDLTVDLRTSPRASAREVHEELRAVVDRHAAAHPAYRFSTELVAAMDAPPTDPDAWIVRSAVGAWERHEGRPHAARTGTSGSTDAAVLRSRGIPTARIGPPAPASPPPIPGFSMGQASVTAMRTLVDVLLDVIVDAATRRDPRH